MIQVHCNVVAASRIMRSMLVDLLCVTHLLEISASHTLKTISAISGIDGKQEAMFRQIGALASRVVIPPAQRLALRSHSSIALAPACFWPNTLWRSVNKGLIGTTIKSWTTTPWMDRCGPFSEQTRSIQSGRSKRGLYDGKDIRTGFNVPFSHKRTRRKFKPNVHKKRLYSETLDEMIRFHVTSKALRSIDKAGGLDNYLLTSKYVTSGEGLEVKKKILFRKRVIAKYGCYIPGIKPGEQPPQTQETATSSDEIDKNVSAEASM